MAPGECEGRGGLGPTPLPLTKTKGKRTQVLPVSAKGGARNLEYWEHENSRNRI